MAHEKITARSGIVGQIKDLLDSICEDNNEISAIEEKYEIGERITNKETANLIWYYYKLYLKEKIKEKEDVILPRDDFFDEIKVRFPLDDTIFYSLYEEYYVHKFLDEAHHIIRRAMSIREVFIDTKPSEELKKYCREAYLTFIYGYHNASVIILRSIIEEVLKRKLNYDDTVSLKVCNDEAMRQGLYSEDIWKKIEEIRKDGRKVAHRVRQTKIPEERNKYLIEIAQKILHELFK